MHWSKRAQFIHFILVTRPLEEKLSFSLSVVFDQHLQNQLFKQDRLRVLPELNCALTKLRLKSFLLLIDSTIFFQIETNKSRGRGYVIRIN